MASTTLTWVGNLKNMFFKERSSKLSLIFLIRYEKNVVNQCVGLLDFSLSQLFRDRQDSCVWYTVYIVIQSFDFYKKNN